MTTTRSAKFVPPVVALACAASATPVAATPELQSDAATRKAIRDDAQHGPSGTPMQAHNVRVDCVQAVKVGSEARQLKGDHAADAVLCVHEVKALVDLVERDPV